LPQIEDIMSETTHETGGAGPSHRSVEAGVTLAMAAIGLITIIGSLRIGAGWGPEGPQAGFLPFYMGLSLILASAVNLAQLFRHAPGGQPFAAWSQLRRVMAVVIPTGIYVFAIPSLGIYLSSMVLIAAFMRWLGRYPWLTVAAVAIGMPILTFFLFEVWFLVPLPKGPLEHQLGY
jgi:putative tricarboxylic transport membrane protein